MSKTRKGINTVLQICAQTGIASGFKYSGSSRQMFYFVTASLKKGSYLLEYEAVQMDM
jgi:hypothetical protein